MKKDTRNPKDYVEVPWGKLKKGMVVYGIFSDVVIDHKVGIGSDVQWLDKSERSHINWTVSRLVKKGSF